MEKITCGIFLYDTINKKLLLVKSYGSRKLEGYSIPRGHFDEDLDSDFLHAALREFQEECGQNLINLVGGEENFKITKEFDLVFYKNVEKKLKSFLIVFDEDLSDINFQCESFWQSDEDGEWYPEIASYHWMDLDEAKEKAHYTQRDLIVKIKEIIP